MNDYFLSQPLLFFGGIAVATVLWLLAGRIPFPRLRNAARISVAFLGCPLAAPGHPLLYGSVWMLFVGGIANAQWVGLAQLVVAWLVVALVGQWWLNSKVTGANGPGAI
jgi:hypothetical protein